jgi:RNA polymerase sigma-70 factor, ECF subfamily
MKAVAGATTLAELASALGCPHEETSIVAELQCGSEQAYAWLIAQYQQPVYNLVYRIVNDAADASDTTQEVFLKVFRGVKSFNGRSSLKTWIYRIAVHEASNRKRWWFRHKSRERSIEPLPNEQSGEHAPCLKDTLRDGSASPFDELAREELRARVEHELSQIDEPFRTTVVLRDIEELSYDEIAEVLQVSLGTVKSRLMRGREALKRRLLPLIQEVGPQMGIKPGERPRRSTARAEKLRSALHEMAMLEEAQEPAVEVTS